MQSIERDDMPQVLPAYHSLPSTPQAVRPMQPQHHVVDLTQDSPGYYALREIPRQDFDRREAFRPTYHNQEVVDLTSPRGQYNERPMAQPEVIRVIPVRDDRYAPAPVDQYGHTRVPENVSQAWRVDDPYVRVKSREHHAAEYDPDRPILDARDRGVYNAAPTPRFGSPTQPSRQQFAQPSSRAYDQGQPMVQYTYPPSHGTAYPAPVPQSRSVPVPVHGAPAPVQQMPRELGPAPKPRHIPNSRRDPITLDGAGDPPGYPVYTAPQFTQHYPR